MTWVFVACHDVTMIFRFKIKAVIFLNLLKSAILIVSSKKAGLYFPRVQFTLLLTKDDF